MKGGKWIFVSNPSIREDSWVKQQFPGKESMEYMRARGKSYFYGHFRSFVEHNEMKAIKFESQVLMSELLMKAGIPSIINDFDQWFKVAVWRSEMRLAIGRLRSATASCKRVERALDSRSLGYDFKVIDPPRGAIIQRGV